MTGAKYLAIDRGLIADETATPGAASTQGVRTPPPAPTQAKAPLIETAMQHMKPPEISFWIDWMEEPKYGNSVEV